MKKLKKGKPTEQDLKKILYKSLFGIAFILLAGVTVFLILYFLGPRNCYVVKLKKSEKPDFLCNHFKRRKKANVFECKIKDVKYVLYRKQRLKDDKVESRWVIDTEGKVNTDDGTISPKTDSVRTQVAHMKKESQEPNLPPTGKWNFDDPPPDGISSEKDYDGANYPCWLKFLF